MMVGSPSQNEAGEPSSSSSSTAPSPIPLRNLFHFSRFSLDRSLLYLLLWSPVGLVLACVRFLLALQFLIVGCFLPEALWNRGVLVRWILGLLGIAVRVDSDSLEWSSEKGRILISNHISPVDPLVIHSLTDSIAPSSPSPPWLLQALGVKFYVDRNTQYAVNALRTNPQGRPILVLPEGTTTNGHIGLLEFHQSWFESFSGDMLQPVYLSAWRPFPKVALTTVESPFWGDIFWMFFSPFTLFTIRFLSPVHARVGADGVRGRIAEAGGLALTPHKLGDKKEMLKRMRQEAAERNQQANAPGNAYGGSFSYPIGQVRSGINIESFAERKRVMIEEARRKYIEKHGLNLPSTSLPSVN